MTLAAEICLVAGATVMFLGALGVVSFRDVLNRIHALSMTTTLGLMLVFLGGVVGLDRWSSKTIVVLAAGLQLLTSPVASNLLARASYRAGGIETRMDAVDELSQRSERRGADGSGS